MFGAVTVVYFSAVIWIGCTVQKILSEINGVVEVVVVHVAGIDV